MNRILKLCLLWMLAAMPALAWGQYNPDSPGEPGVPPQRLTLEALPPEGGSVYGAGRYVPGNPVTVRASENSGYAFAGWTDGDGNMVSEETEYTFIMPSAKLHLTANFRYNPGQPSEPVPGEQLLYYTLKVAATTGGSANGGGRYRSGTNVTLIANPESNFEFDRWVNQDGETVSESRIFYYVTQPLAEILTAHFRYNPNAPAEPSEPVLSRKIEIRATDGGGASMGSGKWAEGTVLTIGAFPNTGYRLVGWYLDGVFYSDERVISYTVGDRDAVLEARFRFDPDSPGEPAKPTDKQFSFYLMSSITYPGKNVTSPIYFTSLDPVRDMTFQLTFPQGINPMWETLSLSDMAEGYNFSVTPGPEPGVYALQFTGGELPAGNTKLLELMLEVPETVELGSDYQVKINQVSLTQEDLSTATASTRNGRVYVYKLGDTNGDGTVDVMDCVNMSTFLLSDGRDNEIFIPEVSDVNEDAGLDVVDYVGLVNIILNSEE